MKYKLIKSFPNSPELGEILDFTNDDIVIDTNQRSWAIEDCENYPQFWKKVVEVEYKVGDIVVVANRGDTFSMYSTLFKECKFKNTEENDSFENGTIAICFAVAEHENEGYESGLALGIESQGKQSLIATEGVRKATNDEIILFYQQQGWVKGAKFKHNITNNIYIIDEIIINIMNDIYIHCEQSFGETIPQLKDCELVKKTEYSIEFIEQHFEF